MSIMAAAIQGLPPLPKSLSGLLNFNRESFSRENALRNPAAAQGGVGQPPGGPNATAVPAGVPGGGPPHAHFAQQQQGQASQQHAQFGGGPGINGAGNSGTMSSGYHSATSVQASPSPSPFR